VRRPSLSVIYQLPLRITFNILIESKALLSRTRSCGGERRPETMKTNHEDTKKTKKDWKKTRALRFFVVGFSGRFMLD
jgi:hypothetical protein